jgi:hypothetical protein
MASLDFFAVPKIPFQILYVLRCWHTTADAFSTSASRHIRRRSGLPSNFASA